MSTTRALRGVYAITPTDWDRDRLIAACAQALDAGIAALQYRDKPAPSAATARELATLCNRAGVPLLINDDVALAAELGVGAHVGRSDTAVTQARAMLGPAAWVGASVYDDVSRACAAEAEGASYVSFGRFYASRTKPDATPAHPDILARAAGTLAVPIVAIGGIRADNGAALVAAGADCLAAVDAVFGAPDIAAAVAALNTCFAPDV